MRDSPSCRHLSAVAYSISFLVALREDLSIGRANRLMLGLIPSFLINSQVECLMKTFSYLTLFGRIVEPCLKSAK